MRRLTSFTAAALVLLAGCGTEQPGAAPGAEPSNSPAATPSSTPTPTHAPEPSPIVGQQDSLTEFPLALGYPTENGDDGSRVRVTDKPATRAFKECEREAWDPSSGVDVIGVEFRGEAEWFRGRTLVVYPSVDAATAAVDTVADVITSCPRDRGTDVGWTEHTGIDYYVGDQSFGWMDRYWSSEVDGFDTGLTVYHVARVGSAVLLTYEYGEGNGSEETRQSAIGQAAREDRSVVDAMDDLPTEDLLTLTPRGVGPFRLGMSVEEARAAGGEVRLHGGAAACPELPWTSPSDATVKGAFSPGSGLGYVSVDGGRTAEGITLGASVADLHAAYPDLQHADNGLWYVDREPGDLAFATYDGGVNWMVAMGDDQHCAG